MNWKRTQGLDDFRQISAPRGLIGGPRVEVITSVQRRRRWPTAEKIRKRTLSTAVHSS
jgi:hypothetical protein